MPVKGVSRVRSFNNSLVLLLGTSFAERASIKGTVTRDGVIVNEPINWSISDTSIADFSLASTQYYDKRELIGKVAGTTTLTAETKDGVKTTFTVTVLAEPNYYNDLAYIADDKSAVIIGYRGDGGDIIIPSEINGKPVLSVQEFAFDTANNKKYAGAGCKQITNITVSEGVKVLGTCAFQGLHALKTISIPASVIKMDTDGFNGQSLTAINVALKNPNYSSDGGVLFNKTKTILHKYPPCKSDAKYIIPDTVVCIDIAAFMNNLSIKSVTMPINLVQISRNGFRLCNNLESVYFKGDTPIFAGSGPELAMYMHVFKDAGGNNFPNMKIYYPKNSSSWTYPEWGGYPTESWDFEEETDFVYTVSGDEITITGYNGSSEYVLIPSKIGLCFKIVDK